jgi:hypothetical protein
MKKTAALSLMLLSTACASVTGPGKQQVRVDTVPQGAEVRVADQVQTSPAVFTLKGKGEYTVIAEKEGYKTSTGLINGEPRIWASVVGNIFNLTGIVGVGIDYFATGAAYDLDDSVVVALRPEVTTAPIATPAPLSGVYKGKQK